MDVCHVLLVSALSQFPGAITVTKSDFVNIVPVEVAGWMMRRSPSEGTRVPWVLVLTDDLEGRLAAGLITRGPVVCSVTMGLTQYLGGAADVERLQTVACETVGPKMKAADALVPLTWDRAPSQLHTLPPLVHAGVWSYLS